MTVAVTTMTVVSPEEDTPLPTKEVNANASGGSGWPWMKGQKFAIALTPIAPVCEEDDRQSVLELIDEYRAKIDQVADNLVGESPVLFDPSKHDDLWILRFLLSHKGNVKSATKVAIATLQFRHQHSLDTTDIRSYPPGKLAVSPRFHRYYDCCSDDAIQFEVPHPQRGVMAYLKGTGFDLHALLANVDYQDRFAMFSYISEWTHQWLDYVTRTTGRLTKAVRLVDAKGFALSQISYEGLRLDAKVMCSMEDYYPQLLQCFFICDPPSYAQYPWRILRPLLPKRIVKKIDFISPANNKKERKRLLKYVNKEHLPIKFGGSK